MLILWDKNVIAWNKVVAVFRLKNIVVLRNREVMAVEEATEIVCIICTCVAHQAVAPCMYVNI